MLISYKLLNLVVVVWPVWRTGDVGFLARFRLLLGSAQDLGRGRNVFGDYVRLAYQTLVRSMPKRIHEIFADLTLVDSRLTLLNNRIGALLLGALSALDGHSIKLLLEGLWPIVVRFRVFRGHFQPVLRRLYVVLDEVRTS